MIGPGLKKLAAENGMKVSKGVAYGALKGYATTMSEGKGYKRFVIMTRFETEEQKDALLEYVNERNIRKEFRITNLVIAGDGIVIEFYDDPGTMKKINAFVEWFYPLLPQYSASGANICSECGGEIIDGCWKLVNGNAVHIHTGCANSLASKFEYNNEKKREEAKGSYFTGFIGALIGAIIGAILWGIVGSFGRVAAIIGFVIGWLADKGYNLFRGKQGKGKVAILIITVFLGVLFGTLCTEAFVVAQMISAGEIYGTFADIPAYILYAILIDPEYLTIIFSNFGLGVLFAGIGVFSVIRKASREVADDKIIDLE